MGFVTDVVLPLALAFIMLALGLGLTFDDFVRVVRRPLDFAVGARRVPRPAVLFVLVLGGAIYQERDNLVTYYSQAGLATFTLNLLMMAIAYLLARQFATGAKQRTAIAIECGAARTGRLPSPSQCFCSAAGSRRCRLQPIA